jgi:hypothetical protein
MIVRAFKSFFRSGSAFSEQILPKFLGNKPGVILGTAAGLASVFTGICFFAAIPMSVPMFLVAHGMFAGKGAFVAAAATVFLGGVGSVVTTTGLGMMRAATRGIFSAVEKRLYPKAAAAPVPGKSSFNGAATSRAEFKTAAAASPPSKPQAADSAITKGNAVRNAAKPPKT